MRTAPELFTETMARSSYRMTTRATLEPSRIFWTAGTSVHPITGADAKGCPDSPVMQEVAYSPVSDKLVTFYSISDKLSYSIEGSSSRYDTNYDCKCKPGVYGDYIFTYDGSLIKRYEIDWSLIASHSLTPLTGGGMMSVAEVQVIHAVGEQKAVFLKINEAALAMGYLNFGTATVHENDENRFMFPVLKAPEEDDTRTLKDLAINSGGAFFDNKYYIYVSNSKTGAVQGAYYDIDTSRWSDIFTVVPTEMDVSQCEVRVTNAYVHNNYVYMCCQFRRLDAYIGSDIYTLILRSDNGRKFSLDRFSLVSDIGYRFLATVGNSKLYIGACNRVCYDDITWTFNGDCSTEDNVIVEIPQTDINNFNDRSLESASLELRAASETYMFGENIVESSRVKVYVGYQSTSGSVGDDVLYGTYIVDQKQSSIRDGARTFELALINESMWKLSGLSMPFYAELFGRSCIFDPMTDESMADTGIMYAATNAKWTEPWLTVDFWNAEPWTSTALGITGIEIATDTAPYYYEATGTHNVGFQSRDLKEKLSLSDYPKVVSESVTLAVYGWSHPIETGSTSDIVEVALITTNDKGKNRQVHISDENKRWPCTWPSTAGGDYPIILTITGLTVDHVLRRVALSFSGTDTWLCPTRVDIVSGVEVTYSYSDANTKWDPADGAAELPGYGRPYIMFSQRPYNTFNFHLSAEFNNTVTGGSIGDGKYPVAVGLVGLAWDGLNYVVGRYNVANNKCELVKVRNGISTVLASETPGWTIGELQKMQFKHKDGRFYIYMWKESTSKYTFVLGYNWAEVDGYMISSDAVVLNCGVYGIILSPSFRITGLNLISSENSITSYGVGYIPSYSSGSLGNMTDWPDEGDITIDKTTYHYTEIVDPPNIIRGPFQFRQSNKYNAPYGTGEYGTEITDFSWNAPTNYYNDNLLALSLGSAWKITGSLWQVWDKTGGDVEYHPNRSRQYVDDTVMITKVAQSLATKVWITGGLGGLTKVSGDRTSHYEGAIATLKLEGTITCSWYMGVGGDDDTTLSDLIDNVCCLSAAKANFPGDYTSGSAGIVISGDTEIITQDYVEGVDIRFETDNTPSQIDFIVNVPIDPDNYEEEETMDDDTGTKVSVIHNGSGSFDFYFYSYPSDTLLWHRPFNLGTDGHNYRLLYHESFITFIMDSRWIGSICTEDLVYTTATTITLSGSFTANNLIVRELMDWRDAVYIDLQTDGMSAISSIVQERPVEITPKPDGSLDFWYAFVRDAIATATYPRTHSWVNRVPTEGASDAIVQGSAINGVRTLQYTPLAQAVGFSTRVFSFPDIDVGAKRAALMVLKKIYESREMHQLTIRPDVRIEVGDLVTVDYLATPTAKAITKTIVVEDVTLNVAGSEMTISGREYYEQT